MKIIKSVRACQEVKAHDDLSITNTEYVAEKHGFVSETRGICGRKTQNLCLKHAKYVAEKGAICG
jgi:hypothetical protein